MATLDKGMKLWQIEATAQGFMKSCDPSCKIFSFRIYKLALLPLINALQIQSTLHLSTSTLWHCKMCMAI